MQYREYDPIPKVKSLVPKTEGFPFGNTIFPEGTLMEIGEHEHCIGARGEVRRIDHKNALTEFVIACIDCGKMGLSVIRQITDKFE